MSAHITLLSWVRSWNRILEDPESLFFSITIGNICPILLKRIDFMITEKRKKFPRYERNLYKTVISLLDRKKYVEKRIIYLLKPSILRELSRLHRSLNLSKLQLGQLKKMRKCLSEISQCYKTDRFLIRLKNILFSLPNTINRTNHASIYYIIEYFLLRSLASRYTIEYLQDLPEKIFTKTYFDHHRSTIIKKVQNDSRLTDSIPTVVSQLAIELQKHESKLQNEEELETFLERIFYSNEEWKIDINHLVRMSRNTLLRHKDGINRVLLKEQNLSDSMLGKGQLLNSLNDILSKCINRITRKIVLECLEKYYSPSGIAELAKKDICKYISSIIEGIVYDHNYSGFRSFANVVADALFWSFVEAISLHISSIVTEEINQSEIKKIGNKLIRFMYDEIGEYPSYFDTLLDATISKFKFQRLIATYTNDTIKNYSCKIIRSLVTFNTTDDHFVESFNASLSKILIDKLHNVQFNRLPTALGKTLAKKLLDALFDELINQEKKYEVCFIIGEFDCKRRVIKIGNVTFYDSREWDFGESHMVDRLQLPVKTLDQELRSEFDVYETKTYGNRKIEYRRNSARAIVEVVAKDPSIAIEEAKIFLKEALDSLVYALSKHNTFGGFRPQVPLYYEVIDDINERIDVKAKSVPHSEMLEANDNHERIFSFYDSFFKSTDSYFKDQLKRCFTWFHKGRWDEVPHAKFLSYWIALEQLITQSTTGDDSVQKTLLKYIPKLTITWRNTGSNLDIVSYLNEIISIVQTQQHLRQTINAHPKLRGWEINPAATILENLRVLKKVSNNTSIQHTVSNLQAYLTNDIKRNIRKQIITLRKREKLKIMILYNRRNSLAHEGITYLAELKFLIAELEKMLESTMDVFLSFKESKGLNKLIVENNRATKALSS